jgi:ubiquinone/menaquinone biosynthesis C-methylase UbiE
MAGAAFDRLAARYDDLWTNTEVGRLQRAAVWRDVRPLFHPGDRILDLGCGTGEDAVRFKNAGMHVKAVDSSPEMVRQAHDRGVAARVLSIEDIDCLPGTFDGVLSNFGALNCVEYMAELRAPLSRLVRPGGHLAVCIMGRFCVWETVSSLVSGQFRKAVRRWSGASESKSLGVRVYYPTVRKLRRALAPDFALTRYTGIGIFLPPSGILGLGLRTLVRLDAIDRRISHLAGMRALSDHRLLIFVRTAPRS